MNERYLSEQVSLIVFYIKQRKRLGDVVFSLILLLHIFAFILINSYLYDCTCFIHSNPV